jgi:hypothetical protein
VLGEAQVSDSESLWHCYQSNNLQCVVGESALVVILYYCWSGLAVGSGTSVSQKEIGQLSEDEGLGSLSWLISRMLPGCIAHNKTVAYMENFAEFIGNIVPCWTNEGLIIIWIEYWSEGLV